jgi:hypothetical protein
MPLIRKFTIGILPFTKMFRVHGLGGAATDAVLKLRGKGLSDTYFDDVVIKTSFNWLSFKGDPKRTYRFESGTYIEDPSHADDVYTQIVARLPDMKVPEPKIF